VGVVVGHRRGRRGQILGLSGSDLEAVLVRAVLEAEAAESAEVLPRASEEGLRRLRPSSNSREREMQILCAVMESTSRTRSSRSATAPSTAAKSRHASPRSSASCGCC